MDKLLKVVEIFDSVQGEGANAGAAMVFVRLHGCSMGCTFCDTKISWKGDAFKLLSTTDILETVKRHAPVPRVCITGGEPFEQDILELVLALKRNGYYVFIETNGFHFNAEVAEAATWIAISPKTDIHEGWQGCFNELKFVVQRGDPEEFQKIWDFYQANNVAEPVEIFLQPCNNDRELAQRIADYVRNVPRFRMGYQLHKTFSLR